LLFTDWTGITLQSKKGQKALKKIKLLIMHPELVVGGAEKVLLNMLDVIDRDKFQITLLLRNRAVWDEKVPADVDVHYMFQKNPMHSGKITARVYKYMMIFFRE